MEFTETQINRYSRHILLPQIGIEGQENIVKARALVNRRARRSDQAASRSGSSGEPRVNRWRSNATSSVRTGGLLPMPTNQTEDTPSAPDIPQLLW